MSFSPSAISSPQDPWRFISATDPLSIGFAARHVLFGKECQDVVDDTSTCDLMCDHNKPVGLLIYPRASASSAEEPFKVRYLVRSTDLEGPCIQALIEQIETIATQRLAPSIHVDLVSRKTIGSALMEFWNRGYALSVKRQTQGVAKGFFLLPFEKSISQATTPAAAAKPVRTTSMPQTNLTCFSLLQHGHGKRACIRPAVQPKTSTLAQPDAGFAAAFPVLQWIEYVEKGNAHQDALEVAYTGLAHEDAAVRGSALVLLGKLLDRKQGYEATFKKMVSGRESPEPSLQRSAQLLRVVLLSKWERHPELRGVIKQAILGADQSADKRLRAAGLSLLQELFAEGRGFPEAIRWAQEGMNDPHHGEMSRVLFRRLFHFNQGAREAIESVQTHLQSHDPKVQRNALFLAQELIQAKQGLSEIVDALEGVCHMPIAVEMHKFACMQLEAAKNGLKPVK